MTSAQEKPWYYERIGRIEEEKVKGTQESELTLTNKLEDCESFKKIKHKVKKQLRKSKQEKGMAKKLWKAQDLNLVESRQKVLLHKCWHKPPLVRDGITSKSDKEKGTLFNE